MSIISASGVIETKTSGSNAFSIRLVNYEIPVEEVAEVKRRVLVPMIPIPDNDFLHFDLNTLKPIPSSSTSFSLSLSKSSAIPRTHGPIHELLCLRIKDVPNDSEDGVVVTTCFHRAPCSFIAGAHASIRCQCPSSSITSSLSVSSPPPIKIFRLIHRDVWTEDFLALYTRVKSIIVSQSKSPNPQEFEGVELLWLHTTPTEIQSILNNGFMELYTDRPTNRPTFW